MSTRALQTAFTLAAIILLMAYWLVFGLAVGARCGVFNGHC